MLIVHLCLSTIFVCALYNAIHLMLFTCCSVSIRLWLHAFKLVQMYSQRCTVDSGDSDCGMCFTAVRVLDINQ